MCREKKLHPLLLLIGSLFLFIVQSDAAPPAGYVLVWSDEFEGTFLNTNKWEHRLPGPRNDAINTSNAVSLSNGVLTITTYTEGGTNFTGMIGTEDLYMPLYGYFEARINFNDSSGGWSAFWMTSPTMTMLGDPHSYGTEIDIAEHRAVNANNTPNSNRALAALHWDGYGAEHKTVNNGLAGAGLATGWHLFALEWTTNFQKFYYDGNLVWTVTNSPAQVPIPPEAPVSQRSQYLILSSEVRDDNWAGTIPVAGYGNRSNSTTKMNVDYVRSYIFVPQPVLSVTNPGSGIVSLSFYGVAGLSYVLERSNDLLTWTNVATKMAPTNGLIVHTNLDADNVVYFRVHSN
jgi:beta-glucanase (GH16 family)